MTWTVTGMATFPDRWFSFVPLVLDVEDNYNLTNLPSLCLRITWGSWGRDKVSILKFVSCKECNGYKGTSLITKSPTYNKFPTRSSNYTIVHAHYDRYEDHITALVPGITYRYKGDKHGKGWKTIEVCGLLRYHEEGGRTQVDPIIQAGLRLAADDQRQENLRLAIEMLQGKINALS